MEHGSDSIPVGFPSTLWTLVHEVKERPEEGPGSRAALEALFERYWKPVYWFIRLEWRRDHNTSLDLTQSFFLDILESDFVGQADRDRGRFRNFLRTRLRRFLMDRGRADQAVRRGGGTLKLAIDEADLDSAQVLAAGRELGPEQVFEREWSAAIVGRATEGLKARFAGENRSLYFEVFRLYDLEGDGKVEYRTVAAKLGLSEDDVRNYLRVARAAFRDLIRAEIRDTVGSTADLKEELNELFAWME